MGKRLPVGDSLAQLLMLSSFRFPLLMFVHCRGMCRCSCAEDQLQEGDGKPSGLPSPLAVRALHYLKMAMVSSCGDSRHIVSNAEHLMKREDAE